jgi:hypothetical protein
VVEQERRDPLARHPLRARQLEPFGEHPLVLLGIELLLHRHRIGDEQRGGHAQLVRGGHRRRDLLGPVDAPIEIEAAVGEVEAREAIRAPADDRDAERLQALERRADIEDRLDPRRHHGDRRARQRGQVGRLVPRLARVAVHAA